MKGKKKLVVLAPIVAAVATMFTGCGRLEKDALKDLNAEALKVLNSSPVVSEMVDDSFDKYNFLSADFTETESKDYLVDVSGVAKYNNTQKAFVKMSYSVDGEKLADVDEKNRTAVFDMLSSIIGSEEMKDFDFVPVGSFKALNKTLKNISESPLDDFEFDKGIIFSLGDLKFDEANNGVSFRMKTHVEYSKGTTILQPVYVGTTVAWMPYTTWEKEDFIHTNDIYMSVSADEFKQLNENKSLIFDKFVEFVSSGSKDKYVVNSVEIEKTTKFDTSGLDKVRDVETEMER